MNELIWGPLKVPTLGPLQNDIECEVLVIGGGLAGVLTAYLLQDTHEVVLIEKDTLLSKTSSRTTACITPYQGSIYAPLIKKYGKDQAKAYFDSAYKAIDSYQNILKKEGKEDIIEWSRSFYYTREINTQWTDEIKAYNELGIDYHVIPSPDSIVQSKIMIEYERQAAQFNPIDFINSLTLKFKIYDQTRVIHVDKHSLMTTTHHHHRIKAKYVVVATNFPIIDIPGYFFAKLQRSISYVGIVEPTTLLKGQYLGQGETDYYYRNLGSKGMVGGHDHLTGENHAYEPWIRMHLDNYPTHPYITKYDAMDTMTFDELPMVGPIKENLYVITGFNKWGMANAINSAEIIRDHIQGNKHPLADLLSPSRAYLSKHLTQFAKGMSRNLVSIASQFLYTPLKSYKGIQEGTGDLVQVKGCKRLVYKEGNTINQLHSRCTHFNCQVQWNKDAHCFECPCHGSRYDNKGHVLEGPACFDLDKA